MSADGLAAPKRPKPNSAASLALNELDHLVIDGQFTVSWHHERIPDGAQLVDFEAWREACRKKRLSNGKVETEDRTFRRAVTELSARSLIAQYDKWVWRLSGQGRTK